MSAPSSRMLVLAVAVLVLGTAATASARPKKPSADGTSTVTTMCYGTPIIMQGVDCPTRSARSEEPEQVSERVRRPRLSARGSSGGYVAPLQRTPSLAPIQPSAGPYIPPPLPNPSERINQL